MDSCKGMEAVRGRKAVEKQSITITLPEYLVKAIENYSKVDRAADPSKIGALNAVAFIGEQIVWLYIATKAKV